MNVNGKRPIEKNVDSIMLNNMPFTQLERETA